MFFDIIHLVNSMSHRIIFFICLMLCAFHTNLASIEANLLAINYPIEVNQTAIDEKRHDYPFTPIATIIGFVFIGISFAFLAITKMLYASSDQYMMNNRFDLVIFKPPTTKSVLGPRRVYSNTVANAHNLTAATSCGFDVRMLSARNPYTSFLTANNSPVPANSAKFE